MFLNGLGVSLSAPQLAVMIVVAVVLAALAVLNVLFIVYLKRNVERRLTGGLQEERDRLMKQLAGLNSGEDADEIADDVATPPPPPRKLHDERLQKEREQLLEKMDAMKEADRAARKSEERAEETLA